MARSILVLLVPVVVLALALAPGRGRTGSDPAPSEGQQQARPEFKAAGVCARCHVVSVLEWGVSNHVAAGTSCQKCHGPSKGHVANERNEVKPDRLPRGASIAKTCMGCHEAGCPKTLQTNTCQKCHHVHALVDPNERPAKDEERLAALLVRWDRFRKFMETGERQVQLGRWKAAQTQFESALKEIPGNHRAASRLAMCKRRLNPVLLGFKIIGNEFDLQTGLPKEVTVAGQDIPMVLVPPGQCDLGAEHLVDARPVHTVEVEAFYLGKFEVTQAQWKALMDTNPSIHQGKEFPQAERMPVEHVSWNDCQALIKRLNERVPGRGFRLPTEAEWEYACRAGSDTPLDHRTLEHFAWFRSNSARQPFSKSASQSPDAWAPRPVGTQKPNRWGLYDMQGNVSEWCSSLYRPYLYDARDGRESLDKPGQRVLRGGHFADSVESLDPSLPHPEHPHRGYRWNGLRLARSVPGP